MYIAIKINEIDKRNANSFIVALHFRLKSTLQEVPLEFH